MRWTPGGRSPNLEDRRSVGGGGMGRGLGIGGTVVVLALSLIFGRDLFSDLGVTPAVGAASAPMTAADSAGQEEQVQFISFVLDDVQNVWAKTLPQTGARFSPARLVLFRNSTDSAATAQSAMGPFYCPLDQRVYLDRVFDELQSGSVHQVTSPAHMCCARIGHHVQHLQGRMRASVRLRRAPFSGQRLSVRLSCGGLLRVVWRTRPTSVSYWSRGSRRSSWRPSAWRRPHSTADDGT